MRLAEEDIALIEKMVDDGCISRQKHPLASLYILNYTKKANFNKVWNRATKMCRGLIVDEDWNVVARPFEKFFNYEEIAGSDELKKVENEQFEIYEKLDGSLGILYWIGNILSIATRGSFVSDQANHATKVLFDKYSDVVSDLDKSKTYLFEIIYPEDKKVVNYGDLDDIVLLAVIDTETGEEQDIADYSRKFRCVARYNGADWRTIRKMTDSSNREGFVVKFKSGFRMKLKFDEYFKLAALKINLTYKRVVDCMIDGSIEELSESIKQLDWETQVRYDEIVEKITREKIKILMRCRRIYEQYKHFDGKEFALAIKNYDNKQIIFALKNNKSRELVDQLVLKILLQKESQL